MFTPQFAKAGREAAGSASASSSANSTGKQAGRPRRGDLRLRHRVRACCPTRSSAWSSSRSRDVANAVDDAHRQRRPAADARGEGREAAAEDRDETSRSRRTRPQALAGRYRSRRPLARPDRALRPAVRRSRTAAAYRVRARARPATDLIADDVARVGHADHAATATSSTLGETTYTKEKPRAGPPPEPPAKWKGLIGEYGWDHNTLYIYEQDGKLHALIEWTEIDPLTEESENVFAFPPDRGMYHGEKLIFTRDKTGRATKVEAANVVVRAAEDRRRGRRDVQDQAGAAARRDCARKRSPRSRRRRRASSCKPDLVDLATIDRRSSSTSATRPTTTSSSTPFYTSAKAYMQSPAAEALARVHEKLKPSRATACSIHDAYRPWYVTKMFWDATPEKFHNFVADPSKGSRHNRGCAVDLDAVRPEDRQGGRDGQRLRRVLRPRVPRLPRRHVAAALAPRLLRGRWRPRASRCTRRSGGTSTTRTGGSTRS